MTEIPKKPKVERRRKKMYDMKVKTPPMANKRRSWTGRLKDRFKSSAGGSAGLGDSSVQSCGPADDWTAAWVTHPHLQEGHHAPSVPSLQGSVFVAANFVYDYRQKYGLQDPGANGWMANPAVGSVAVRRTTTDWTTTRGLYPAAMNSSSPVFRTDAMDSGRITKVSCDYSAYEFKAADVNQNIRQMRQHHKVSVSHTTVPPPPLPASPPPPHHLSDFESSGEDSQEEEEEEDSHPQTTVAVDRPGLIVSGQRICILTGQDSPASSIQAEKVSLKVEFQRSCPLRRSLSDRARPKMAAPASFHDTTRLTQKTRSRGSLHDLFGITPPHPEPLQITIPAATDKTPVNRRKTIVRPTEPPPPPPPPTGICILIGSNPEDVPPVAPPRRVYRYSKADSDSLTLTSSVKSGSDTPTTVPVTPTSPPPPLPTLDLSPGVTSWAGRPLIGQVSPIPHTFTT